MTGVCMRLGNGSFGDKCVPKREFGNEGANVAEDKCGCRWCEGGFVALDFAARSCGERRYFVAEITTFAIDDKGIDSGPIEEAKLVGGG